MLNYLFLIVILVFSFQSRAEFLTFPSQDKYEITFGDSNIFYYRVPIYSPQDSPSQSSPGNGQAFIKIDLSFSQGAEIAVFKDSNAGNIGYIKDGIERVCCTGDIKDSKNCSIGTVISNGESLDKASYWVGHDQTKVEKNFAVEETAVYYLLLANCKESTTIPALQVEGKVEFMNPYGELPGDEYYYKPYYGGLSMVYLGLSGLWLILSVWHWRKLLSLQHIISGVLILSVIESLTSYFDYLGYNNIGDNWAGAMITGAIASVIKRTVSRLVLLGLAQGRGVTKGVWGDHAAAPSPGSGMLKAMGRGIWGWCIGGGVKVMVLGTAYFIMATLLASFELMRVVADHSTRDIMDGVSVFLIWPVGILDAIFYWWILLSIFQTVAQLQAKKQVVKLRMYQHFLYMLMALGACSAILILAQVIVIMKKSVDERWKYEWLWNGVWGIYYGILLIGLMLIWRPNADNSRYAYSELQEDPSNPSSDPSDPGSNEIVLEPLTLSFGDINKRSKPPSEDAEGTLSPSSADSKKGNEGASRDEEDNEHFVSLKMD